MNAIAPAPPVYPGRPSVIDYVLPLISDRTEPEDHLLAQRLLQRDEDALRDVYERYSRPVFAFLVRFIGDRPAAEDVQQQVFMEVWQKASRFDPQRGSMMTWIMTIARSRALDFKRRRIPEPRDPSGATELAGSTSGESEIEEIVGAWHFNQLIGQLPPEEAELLRYRFDGELSQTEISSRTGIPLGTVKSRMVSALDRLRTLMEVEA
jgi:RNA polymerase sigma-70 factor, ECF subfamily